MAIANIAKKALKKVLSGHTKDTDAEVKASSDLLETTKKTLERAKQKRSEAEFRAHQSARGSEKYDDEARAAVKAKGRLSPEATELYKKSDRAYEDKLNALKDAKRYKNLPYWIAKATSTKK